MYSNFAKGLGVTPLATILPQTGNTINTLFFITTSILIAVLIITLVMVELKKHFS